MKQVAFRFATLLASYVSAIPSYLGCKILIFVQGILDCMPV